MTALSGTTLKDNFDRADSTPIADPRLGANWSVAPYADSAVGLGISSNRAYASTYYGYEWWNVETFNGANGTIEVRAAMPVLPGNGGIVWLALLQQPSSSTATCDGYEFGLTINTGGNDTAEIIEITNASGTGGSLGTAATVNWAANDVLCIRRSTAGLLQLISDRGGTETVAFSVTDTTYTGAFYAAAGFYDPSSGVGRIDDFSAGVTASGTVWTKAGLAIIGP